MDNPPIEFDGHYFWNFNNFYKRIIQRAYLYKKNKLFTLNLFSTVLTIEGFWFIAPPINFRKFRKTSHRLIRKYRYGIVKFEPPTYKGLFSNLESSTQKLHTTGRRNHRTDFERFQKGIKALRVESKILHSYFASIVFLFWLSAVPRIKMLWRMRSCT